MPHTTSGTENAHRECFCILRCAVTPEERKRAVAVLEYCRKVGDTRGTTLAIASLNGSCCK